MPPSIERIDHVHVFVSDRAASERWYRDVLGFSRVPDLAFWAGDGGPLTLADASGSVHLALFESAARPCRSTIALAASAAEFMAWQAHLSACWQRPCRDRSRGRLVALFHRPGRQPVRDHVVCARRRGGTA